MKPTNLNTSSYPDSLPYYVGRISTESRIKMRKSMWKK